MGTGFLWSTSFKRFELDIKQVGGDNSDVASSSAVYSSDSMRAEKRAVAGNSVLAAIAITTLKIIVGVTTGSLGILSEAAHSGLDLIAAVITFFSVRVSDKPADADHQYGVWQPANRWPHSTLYEIYLQRYATDRHHHQ